MKLFLRRLEKVREELSLLDSCESDDGFPSVQVWCERFNHPWVPTIVNVRDMKRIRENGPRDAEWSAFKKVSAMNFHGNRLRIPIAPNALDHDERVRLWLVIKREGKRSREKARLMPVSKR